MTREKAEQIVKELWKYKHTDKYTEKEIRESLEMAIKALSAEPCEDTISRAEAIEALDFDISIKADSGFWKYRTVIRDMIDDIYNTQKAQIEALPSVQPVRSSVIEDIKAEIENNVEWHFKNHQEDIAQIYSDVLNIIDKHIADMRGAE